MDILVKQDGNVVVYPDGVPSGLDGDVHTLSAQDEQTLAGGGPFSWVDGALVKVEIDLATAKEKKRSQIDRKAKAEEFGDFTVGQYTLTADDHTRTEFLMAKREVDADPNYILEDYMKPDGTFVDVTAVQITAVYDALRDHIKAVRVKQRQKVLEITEATTVEQVKVIVWE